MSGILCFATMEAAVRAGFRLHDRIPGGGYIVRAQTPAGWALAIVAER